MWFRTTIRDWSSNAHIFTNHDIAIVKLIWSKWVHWEKQRSHTDWHPASMVRIVFSSVLVNLTVVLNWASFSNTYIASSYCVRYFVPWSKITVSHLNVIECELLTPPVVLFLNTTSGLLLFNRIPTASSSCSSNRLCSSDLVASSIMRITSAVLAALGMIWVWRLVTWKLMMLTGYYLSTSSTTCDDFSECAK